jgi:hypothetical protein
MLICKQEADVLYFSFECSAGKQVAFFECVLIKTVQKLLRRRALANAVSHITYELSNFFLSKQASKILMLVHMYCQFSNFI